MQISVCMGIYNGSRYIEEQLECIRKQTRQPDEVILCDDGSADGTREVIRTYLEKHQELAGWKYIENDHNMGYPGNFYHAMERCTGDVVFLADQDDVWDLRKIERMSTVLEQRQDIRVLACTFGLIDADNEAIHTVMAPGKGAESGEIQQISVRRVFYKCEWPGMVLAYRNAWYQKKKADRRKIPHDFLLCAWAAEEEGFFRIDEMLAYHRRHDNNTGGEEHRIRRLLDKGRKLKEIRDYRLILDMFAAGEVMGTAEGAAALRQKRESMAGREEALCSGRIITVLKNAWRHRADVRIATVVCDVWIVRQRA